MPLSQYKIPLDVIQGLDQVFIDDRGEVQLNLIGEGKMALDEIILLLVSGLPVFSSPAERQHYF